MTRKPLIKLTLIASLAVAGCSTSSPTGLINWKEIAGVYRIPIHQGNLITQEMVNELELGMSKQQVLYLLGTPSIQDIFNEERWDYVHTYRPGSRAGTSKTRRQHLMLHFENDLLYKMEGIPLPQDQETARLTREENREQVIVVPPDAPRDERDSGFWGDL